MRTAPFCALPIPLRGLLDLPVTNAGRTHPHPLSHPVDNRADRLQVDVPAALGQVMGVTDSMAELGTPAANIANSCHVAEFSWVTETYCTSGIRGLAT